MGRKPIYSREERCTGIYAIVNTVTGRRYIGKAGGEGFRQRWTDHRRRLATSAHYNKALQEDWNRYGAKSFRFDILEFTSRKSLLDRERWYISNAITPLYNH